MNMDQSAIFIHIHISTDTAAFIKRAVQEPFQIHELTEPKFSRHVQIHMHSFPNGK